MSTVATTSTAWVVPQFRLCYKQRLLAVTKCDLIDEDIEKELARTLPKRIPHVFISSASGEGLDKLKDKLWQALQK